MAEKITTVTQLMAFVTELAVRKVGEANQSKRLTGDQWFATVEKTVETMLPKILDNLAEEDPANAARLEHQLMTGLKEAGYAD